MKTGPLDDPISRGQWVNDRVKVDWLTIADGFLSKGRVHTLSTIRGKETERDDGVSGSKSTSLTTSAAKLEFGNFLRGGSGKFVHFGLEVSMQWKKKR